MNGGACEPPAPLPVWLAQTARHAGRLALRLLYPPACVACEAGVDDAFSLCPACWAKMPFITSPYCNRLGTPFAVDYGMAMLSPAAIAEPPRFDRARAAAVHDGLARELISRFKYGERLDLARLLARLMVQAGAEVIAEADLIIPVPLHATRLWWRRYNQAAVLAQEIGRITGLPVSLHSLKRIKRTRAQVGLNRAARRNNLSAAFQVEEAASLALAGKRVLLIDDVRTTGSTLNACAHVLRKAGAARIDGLTFSLVPEGGLS